MDFLNRSLAQLKSLFQSMTPQARVTTGLLLVVLVVSMGYLFTYYKSGSYVYLFDGSSFSAGETQAMETAFASKGLSDYHVEGGRIRIPRGERDQYIAAVAEGHALPYSFGSHIEEALSGGNMLRSGDERGAYLEFATEKELSQIIRNMTGIESAAVFYNSHTTRGLRRQEVATASVAVKPIGNQTLDPAVASGIRKLVAAAFANLDEKNVTVMDQIRGTPYVGDPDDPSNVFEDRYIGRQRHHEQSFEEKIRRQLAHIPGLQVKATVTLDNEVRMIEDTVEHNPKTVPVETSESESTRSVTAAATGGRPGAVAQANTGRSLDALQSSGPDEEETDSQTTTVNAVSSTRTSKESVGLLPKLVTAAVGIPASYFEDLWRKRNPPDPNADPEAPPEEPDPAAVAQIQQEEITKIQKHVSFLLPDAVGVTDKTQLVDVTVYPDPEVEEIAGPGVASRAMGWLGQHWSTLGLIVLVAFSLVMVRSMVRSAGAYEPVSSGTTPSSGEPRDEEADVTETAAERRLKRFESSGLSLQEELSELVNEDPDAAANILRAWIGNAS